MKRAIRANTLISTLVLLGSLISLLFLGKEAWLDREQITRHSYQRYLHEKFALLDYVAIDETLACNQTAQKTVYYPPANPQYAFHCVFHSLFLKTKPKEKFIVVDDVGQWLDWNIIRSRFTLFVPCRNYHQAARKTRKLFAL